MKKDSGNFGGGNSGVAVNAMHIMHTFGVFQF